MALIRFGFRELGVTRIFAECDTRNAPSWRVLEKSGMHLVSTIERHKEIKGVMTDSYRYEILSAAS
jgi:RimJ/RimL family protein N-acetyltransferase